MVRNEKHTLLVLSSHFHLSLQIPFCNPSHCIGGVPTLVKYNSGLSFYGSGPHLLFSSSVFATCGEGRFVVATTAESSTLSRKDDSNLDTCNVFPPDTGDLLQHYDTTAGFFKARCIFCKMAD